MRTAMAFRIEPIYVPPRVDDALSGFRLACRPPVVFEQNVDETGVAALAANVEQRLDNSRPRLIPRDKPQEPSYSAFNEIGKLVLARSPEKLDVGGEERLQVGGGRAFAQFQILNPLTEAPVE